MSERLRVLLVEDNRPDADLIRETLPEKGPVAFALETVGRLAEARARLADGAFDLVLLDLGLPDSQGLPTFHALKEAAPGIPIIVLTGNDDEEVAVAAVRQGAQDYLIKGQVVGNVLVRAARYAVERTRGEDALRESERKLKEAQRLGHIGHWEYDLDTRAIQWSDMAFVIAEREQRLGPPTEADLLALVSPGEFARLVNLAEQAQGAGTTFEADTQIEPRPGRIKHLAITGTPVTDGGGRVVRVLGTVQDITRRKLAEERVVHLNLMLFAIRDVNQLIVRERNPQRLIHEACAVLVRRRGYGSAMIVLTDEAGAPRLFADAGMGPGFQPLAEALRAGVLPACCRLAERHAGIYPVTDPEEAGRLCPAGADAARCDASCIRLRHGDTTYGYLAVSLDQRLAFDESLFFEMAGDIAFALHDIAQLDAMARVTGERDLVEGELRQSQKMEAIGRLAGGVAHDFNNLLTVINTSCSFIEEELREADPVREDIRTILEASQSAATLTRQLLAFSRRQVLQPQTLDLNALVGGMEKMLSRLLGEDVIVRFTPSPDLGLVRADPGQLEQVVVNLAVNARDAMPEGGTLSLATENADVTDAYAREHGGRSAGRYAKLTVADTGCGMDPEILARAFEPFFTTKPVGRGTGLGLSTVYGIVQQSGGLLAVSSEVARGSTFSVYLPLEGPDAEAWRPATAPARSASRGETILLVEDNAQLRALAARALRKMGYRVHEASGLDEARRIAETERGIHLLLTDVVMPGGSGRAVSEAVLASHPGVKVLFMSGFTDDAILHHHVLDEGVALLQKPFTPDTLGAKVREVLNGGG